MAGWPDWDHIQSIVRDGTVMGSNQEFNDFKKKVLKCSVAELEEQKEHAPVMWSFLLAFAAVKKVYRRLIIQVFNKLMEAPGWAAAWEAQPRLRDQIKTLHEDLQAALGVQHEVLMKSIAPGAMQFVASVKAEEKPETVKVEMQRERILDEIREEKISSRPEAFGGGDEEDAIQTAGPRSDLAALQDGIDAAVAIDSSSKMRRCGLDALRTLRIGCVQCAGKEQLFRQEVKHSHQVFSFLLSLAKVMPDPRTTSKVAEVMNQFMASPSWSASLESSALLQESLQDLPEEVQAALGMQHEKIMILISDAARCRANGEDDSSQLGNFREVADKMKSIRFAVPNAGAAAAATGAASAAAVAGAKGYVAEQQQRVARPTSQAVAQVAQVAQAPPREWQEARTPEGHIYYFNLRTRASQWERPAELGGPYMYTVGEVVEVWSNSQKKWGQGKVEKVENGIVTAEFSLPGGGVAKKELPANHKDLRPVAPAPAVEDEAWPAEEKAIYQSHFEALEGDGDAKGTSVVANFLLSSGLPKRALKQVWIVANPENVPNLDVEIFSRCCRLVGHCQVLGLDSELVRGGDRPLRVKLRDECLQRRPPELPSFNVA